MGVIAASQQVARATARALQIAVACNRCVRDEWVEAATAVVFVARGSVASSWARAAGPPVGDPRAIVLAAGVDDDAVAALRDPALAEVCRLRRSAQKAQQGGVGAPAARPKPGGSSGPTPRRCVAAASPEPVAGSVPAPAQQPFATPCPDETSWWIRRVDVLQRTVGAHPCPSAL